jgi:thioredoxin-dependent peroxiredoxin
MAKLEVGKKAPAFTLINQDGAKVSLKDFAGQRVVLYFYPADDTPGCTTEACQFNDELKAFAQLDTVVLGVSPNNEASHIKFREKYGLKFNLLCDPDKKMMEKYGAYGEKILYGKTVIGVIRSTFIIGPTGTIERTWYSIKTNGHAAKVLEALQG